MRISILSALSGVIALVGVSAFAADSPTVKGLFLITDYPAVTARPGTTSTIPLKLQNYTSCSNVRRFAPEGDPAARGPAAGDSRKGRPALRRRASGHVPGTEDGDDLQ